MTPIDLHIKSDLSHEERDVIDFYKKIKIRPTAEKNLRLSSEKNNYNTFGIYDFSKRNKLSNDTGIGEPNGWA